MFYYKLLSLLYALLFADLPNGWQKRYHDSWVFSTSGIIFSNVDITLEASLLGWYQHSRIWYHSCRIPNIVITYSIARLCGATVSALGQYAEGCWFEPQSGYIKCGIFTVHLNSYVVLVVQCLGLGPYPLSPGMVYPRRPYRLWWVLTLNLNRTTTTFVSHCTLVILSTFFSRIMTLYWLEFFPQIEGNGLIEM